MLAACRRTTYCFPFQKTLYAVHGGIRCNQSSSTSVHRSSKNRSSAANSSSDSRAKLSHHGLDARATVDTTVALQFLSKDIRYREL
jgi:hypothetical protein